MESVPIRMESVQMRQGSAAVIRTSQPQFVFKTSDGQVSFTVPALYEQIKEEASQQFAERIKELEKKVAQLEYQTKYLTISEGEAAHLIQEYIMNKKKSGATKINILEITGDLNLPPEQIERVMEVLVTKSIAKEI